MIPRVVLARVSVLILAAVACAWYALGIRQAQDMQRATSLINGPSSLTPAQARHARTLLHSARTLNPDLTVDILRGELALDQGHPAVAVRALQSVTRREPQNLQAWVQLTFASAKAGDRALTVSAARHVSALFPKVK
jgi:predicted Zn-dependent protease